MSLLTGKEQLLVCLEDFFCLKLFFFLLFYLQESF